ncbi:hypothetical protein EMCRGX_G033092 [Ephydatia muelleri]
MATTKKLTRVHDLPKEVVNRLKGHCITTCKDYLSHSTFELMNILNYTYPQVEASTSHVCKAIAPAPRNALSLYNERRCAAATHPCVLPTSLHNLDKILRGGLLAGTLTEISGPPGCGKTQFCLMLTVIATLPLELGGLGTRVIYIDTEATFSSERLLEMAKARYPAHFASVDRLSQLAAGVHVFSDMTWENLARRLESLEVLLAEQSFGLIVVDSVASPIRKEFETQSTQGRFHRAAELSLQASMLKRLAEDYLIPVVVTNQITTQVLCDQNEPQSDCDWMPEGGEGASEGVVTSALGNTWSHCVSTRMVLQFREGGRRMITVTKSPLCGPESVIVAVQDKGLVVDWTTSETSHPECSNPSSFCLTSRSAIEGWPVEHPGMYISKEHT